MTIFECLVEQVRIKESICLEDSLLVADFLYIRAHTLVFAFCVSPQVGYL